MFNNDELNNVNNAGGGNANQQNPGAEAPACGDSAYNPVNGTTERPQVQEINNISVQGASGEAERVDGAEASDEYVPIHRCDVPQEAPRYNSNAHPAENCCGSREVPMTSEQNEGIGIRYNADENSKEGNYTWQYYRTGNDGRYAQLPVPVKKKQSVWKIIGLVAAGIVGTVVITAATFFMLKYFSGEGNRIDGHIESQNPAPENDNPDSNLPSDRGEIPVIGRKESTDEESANDSLIIVPDEDGKLSKQMIAIKCKPASVGIEVTAVTHSYFGSYESKGVGSGFILTEDGYIATNNHVIEGADEITVMLDDGTKYPAKVIGTDSLTDLAVIKIEAEGLTAIEIGDSDTMRVGDSVIAIGTPAGIEFAGTVTDGIVSAVDRAVEVQGSNGYTKTMHLMQTNAAINPGNSGGPLINDRGEVVGINTLKLTEEYEGIGFSIPINSAVSIFNQLIRDGKVTDYEKSFVTGNGAIGITTSDVTEEEAKFYGIPVGVMVYRVKPDSAAAAAGLKRGDIIVAFNGQTVKTTDEINELKSGFKAGDEVTLTVYRDSEETIDITFKLDIQG